MVQETHQSSFRHGLAFYGAASFLAASIGARTFATLNPSVVFVQGGIHFHHFWYGLAMVVAAGWLGITLRSESLSRNLAIVFGLGTGLIGDEVGLLLTFGNYNSSLEEVFFVTAVSFIILVTLVLRARTRIEKEVLDVSLREKLSQIGIFAAGFSAVFLAHGDWLTGFLILGLGALAFLWGYVHWRTPKA